jgi:hypothetical protein
MMARILTVQAQSLQQHSPGLTLATEPLFAMAKMDVQRVLEILDMVGNVAPEMQKTRTEVLRTAFEDIRW